MKKKDLVGTSYKIDRWSSPDDTLTITIPAFGRSYSFISIDRKRAGILGKLLIHFAATGRLTRRGK